ncbi:hypothetical protein CHUAL_012600 [Chamberlinius hualienensis]
MIGQNQYFALVLCVVFGVAFAFPSSSGNEFNSTALSSGQSTTVNSNRQGKTDLATLVQLVNPTNLAQFKSFFNGASALSNVLSFNIGNLVVLSLLAGTALLIAPALLSFFGLSSFGGLGRSLSFDNIAGKSEELTSMAGSFYKNVDEFLQKYNIDAPTCMQRFACTAARNSVEAQQKGKQSYMDKTLNFVINSHYLSSQFGHTRVMEAVNTGKSYGSCDIEYGKCPFSLERILQYLPIGQSNAIPNSLPTKSQ